MDLTSERGGLLRAAAAVIVLAEALALAVAGGVFMVRAMGESGAADLSVAIGVMALAMGAILAWAGTALVRGRTWPRGLVITWQLLQIAAGWALLEWSVAGGIAVMAAGAAGAAALFADARAGLASQD
ncbi:hypothetical protein [uncultured Demequina sp.]|uniref:hypothetical protein n=1 Tax=uncultured Demequina sp. TaxID=693499 RepID=UPI0025DBE45C|nr:hypothetical protein [uncultured Demequina sp.]